MLHSQIITLTCICHKNRVHYRIFYQLLLDVALSLWCLVDEITHIQLTSLQSPQCLKPILSLKTSLLFHKAITSMYLSEFKKQGVLINPNVYFHVFLSTNNIVYVNFYKAMWLQWTHDTLRFCFPSESLFTLVLIILQKYRIGHNYRQGWWYIFFQKVLGSGGWNKSPNLGLKGSILWNPLWEVWLPSFPLSHPETNGAKQEWPSCYWMCVWSMNIP